MEDKIISRLHKKQVFEMLSMTKKESIILIINIKSKSVGVAISQC